MIETQEEFFPSRRRNGHGVQQPDARETDVADHDNELHDRVSHIEEVLVELRDLVVEQRTVKESYSTTDVAKILERRPYTVREWCRLGRVNAYKAMCGRGCEQEWRISHEELLRIHNEGLLPVPSRY